MPDRKVRIDQAMELAAMLTKGLRACPGVIRLEVCGSLRRRRDTVKDIDILISADLAGPMGVG